MQKTLGVLAALAALAVAVAPVAATAAPAQVPVTIRHAVDPVIASYGAHAVVLVRDTSASSAPLVAYDGSDGSWGRRTVLSSSKATVEPDAETQLALAPNGVGAVAWLGKMNGRQAAVVRLHRSDGTWGRPYRMRGVTWLQGIAVDATGDVAVIGEREFADSDRMLVHVHGKWHSVTAAVNEAQIGIDDSGVVHVADIGVDHGGEGAITVRRWSDTGGWTAPDTVTQPDEMVPGMSFAVQPDGTEYVGVGTVSDRWKSTWDTDAYWATKYYVVERAPGASAWTRVWTRDGAEGLQMVADATNVRLLWQQQGDPDKLHRPQRMSLYTQMLGPDNRADDGSPLRLAGTKGNGGQMERTRVDAVLAPSAGTQPGVAWRIDGPNNDVGRLGVWDYDGVRHFTTTYPAARPGDLEAAVAPGWVVYGSRLVQARGTYGLSDGTVRVVPVG